MEISKYEDGFIVTLKIIISVVRIKAPSEWSTGLSAYCCLIYAFIFTKNFEM